MADQLWFMTRIREEEEQCSGRKVICIPIALPVSTSVNTSAEGTKDSKPANRIPMDPGHKFSQFCILLPFLSASLYVSKRGAH